MNLTPTYGATSAWSSIGAGKGLTGTSAAERLRCISANLVGTKIETLFNGLKKFSTEYVYSGAPTSGQVFIPLAIANDTLASVVFILLFVESGGNVNVEMYGDVGTGGTIGFINGVTLASPTVIRVDIDTSLGVAADRIKVWFNGAAQTITTPTVTADATFAITGTQKLYTHGLNGGFGEDGIIGTVYYASVNNVVPSTDNSTALLSNNDAVPGGGGGGGAPPPTSSLLTTGNILTPTSRLLARPRGQVSHVVL